MWTEKSISCCAFTNLKVPTIFDLFAALARPFIKTRCSIWNEAAIYQLIEVGSKVECDSLNAIKKAG